jgi:hypothetical protein
MIIQKEIAGFFLPSLVREFPSVGRIEGKKVEYLTNLGS